MLEAFAVSLALLEIVVFFRIHYYVLVVFFYFMQFYMKPAMIGTVSRIK